jgi:hypothetical protein
MFLPLQIEETKSTATATASRSSIQDIADLPDNQELA